MVRGSKRDDIKFFFLRVKMQQIKFESSSLYDDVRNQNFLISDILFFSGKLSYKKGCKP